jgi:hypothetical protein
MIGTASDKLGWLRCRWPHWPRIVFAGNRFWLPSFTVAGAPVKKSSAFSLERKG